MKKETKKALSKEDKKVVDNAAKRETEMVKDLKGIIKDKKGFILLIRDVGDKRKSNGVVMNMSKHEIIHAFLELIHITSQDLLAHTLLHKH